MIMIIRTGKIKMKREKTIEENERLKEKKLNQIKIIFQLIIK
jgi:hypothetical protein